MSERARPSRLLILLAIAVAAVESARGEAVDAERWVAAARDASLRGRHGDAVAAFETAIRLQPSRRVEWLSKLADQLTFVGKPEVAIPLYREVLASDSVSPQEARSVRLGLALALSWQGENEAALSEYETLLGVDPSDLEAQLGRARVLSWLHLLGPAKVAYEKVLEQYPRNADARRSLGRVQSWRGRQRDARRLLTSFLADHPTDAEATTLLSQAQDWMGRSDQAKRTLRDRIAAFPEDEHALRLLERIQTRERPEAYIHHQESHQSDDLRISLSDFAQSVYLNDGLTTAGARYQIYRYDSNGAAIDEILVNRPGVYARHRLNDLLEVTGNVFVDLIDSKDVEAADHNTVTYDVYTTIWPNDILRLDAGSKRTTFDNVESLSRNITAIYGAGSVDVLPDERSRLSLRFNWGDYSDGNNRAWWQFEMQRRLWSHAALQIGLRYTGFDFTKRLDSGYFNPDSYHATDITLRTRGQIGEKFFYGIDGSVGVEHGNPGGARLIWSADTRVGYGLSRQIQGEIRYAYFSSAQGSSGGFARGTGGAGFRLRW